jgi:hypothetical protein
MTRRGSPPRVPLPQQWLHTRNTPENPQGSSFGVVLSFAGCADGETLPHLIPLAEQGLAHSGCSRKELKRALAVLVESVQNVIHHGYVDELGDCPFMLTLEYTPVGIQMHCGNLMEKSSAKELAQRIGDLNSLSHADLRKSYIEVLCQGEQNLERGNAGLGLISIAKRTEGPIEFLLEPHNADLDMVTLTSTVKR